MAQARPAPRVDRRKDPALLARSVSLHATPTMRLSSVNEVGKPSSSPTLADVEKGAVVGSPTTGQQQQQAAGSVTVRRTVSDEIKTEVNSHAL